MITSFRRRGENGEPDDEGDEERRKQAIRETLEQHKGEGLDRQAEAILDEAMLAEPTQGTTDWLWKVLVGGLVGALVLALGGLIALAILGKSNQVLVTVFASILTGLLGLFIPGPAADPS